MQKKIFWPKGVIERPKTLYLKEGFRRLGFKIFETSTLMKKFNPPCNPRGPYVYPFIIQIENDFKATVLYDIGTNPDMFHLNPNQWPWAFYFKIHIRKKNPNLKVRNVIVAPNSPSRMEFLDLMPELRKVKDRRTYERDFFFNGWNDDRGLRMKCIKEFKRQDWTGAAGLQPFKHHTAVPKGLYIERLSYENHLLTQATTRINLALAGGFALPWTSFRHVELWGIGAAVLTVSPDCVIPGNSKNCWIEFKRDMSNFAHVIDHYLYHNEAREAYAANGRKYFDEWLLPEKHAAYFIRKIKSKMGLL